MTGTVTLHANDKGDNPKRPDAVGMGTDLNGRRIRAAAWWNADDRTLTVKWEPAKYQPAADQAPPRPPSPPPGSSQATTAAAGNSADEIPF